MPRKLTDNQETQQQLKDAKALESAPRGFLITELKIEELKKKDMGQWHVKKADQ